MLTKNILADVSEVYKHNVVAYIKDVQVLKVSK